MIGPIDALTLAYTKLRTHKIRTGITVGIAGIMFGLILAMVFVVQGVFSSVDKFSKSGLSDRSIVMVTHMGTNSFNPMQYADDKKFIAEVESQHDKMVAKKQSAAKKYGIDYVPAAEDSSPVVVESKTGKKIIPDENMGSPFVEAAAKARQAKDSESNKFDINKYLDRYDSYKVMQNYYSLSPTDGNLTYMDGGKEKAIEDFGKKDDFNPNDNVFYSSGASIKDSVPTVIDGSVTKPLVSNENFDPQKGEIPVILPYSQANNLLGLEPLDKDATTEQKLDRLNEVRSRIGETTFSFCYRNNASNQLLDIALSQAVEKKRLSKESEKFVPDSGIEYKAPKDNSCGPVKVVSDTRTNAEKQQSEKLADYQKAIGEYDGKPVQHKVTFRGVGISSEIGFDGANIGDMVTDLLGSSLGWNTLPIPADMLAEVSSEYKPAAVFGHDGPGRLREFTSSFSESNYLVEFADKEEARQLLDESGSLLSSSRVSSSTHASQFGSNALLIDELKKMFVKVIMWTLIGVGGVGVVILGSMIGRTISESRRESAVFRAIGAKRVGIASIYGHYALLLSLRVAVFAVALGAFIGLVVDWLFYKNATVSAQLAFATSKPGTEFHMFSFFSWYLLLVIVAIIVTSLIASIIPIIRSVRRNPINDMRDE